MTSSKQLQISAASAEGVLTPDRKRFNTLIRQIEQARQAQVDWEKHLALFRAAHSRLVTPLEAQLTEATRESLFALERLLDEPRRTRSERGLLLEILLDGASELLKHNSSDAELKALFDRHSNVGFDAGQLRELQALKDMAEKYTGLDLGDNEGIRTDEDLAQRMYERMAAQEAAEEEQRTEKAQRRRKSPAQQRTEDEARLATQSVRDIYRKLASAVHPDREPDPALRAVRTELMQKVNQAYAANDLLTLLETQLQIEQITVSHIGEMGDDRLRQFNKILARQHSELKAAVAARQSEFCMEFGIAADRKLDPRKLGRFIEEDLEELRIDLARQQRDLRMLSDPEAARRWLKQQRRSARQADYDADFFSR